MATIHQLRGAWLGERGVVVIDSDQAMVRLVRDPRTEREEPPVELGQGIAERILMGYRRLTARE